MALIKCSECGKEISDRATSCPSCGNPLHPQSVTTNGQNKIEIVQTNKKWKKTSLWALTFIIFGFLLMGRSVALGLFMIFIGFIVTIISRIGAWWTNG